MQTDHEEILSKAFSTEIRSELHQLHPMAPLHLKPSILIRHRASIIETAVHRAAHYMRLFDEGGVVGIGVVVKNGGDEEENERTSGRMNIEREIKLTPP